MDDPLQNCKLVNWPADC